MGRRLFILLGALLGCIVVIEFSLKLYNPFLTFHHKETAAWDATPDNILKIEPKHSQKKRTIFYLSTSTKDSLHSCLWLHHVLKSNPQNTSIQFVDISTNQKFLHNITSLKKYLSHHTPNTLVLQIDAGILHDLIALPNYKFESDGQGKLLNSNEIEILKSIKAIDNRNIEDSVYLFNPFRTVQGYKDSFPLTDKKVLKELKAEARLIARNIKSLHTFCNKEGVKLIIIPAPMLWSTYRNDRYSKMPLDQIVVSEQVPTYWYAEIYYSMLLEIKGNLPNKITWVDLYKNFPSDSRFFYDGFRLNDEGQLLFGQMYLGREPLSKEYRSILQ